LFAEGEAPRERRDAMGLIQELFGKSPFGPLVGHTQKVHACVKLVKPLLTAMIEEKHEEVHRLQDQVSKLEYEADILKHEIREQLPRRYFLPVERRDLDRFLSCQDRIADGVEDFAVILLIRETKVHPDLREDFQAFADQVVKVCDILLAAAEELVHLAETAFGGAEADSVLERIEDLGQEEWKSDRMQREMSIKMYKLESELDPMTIVFYEKMMRALSSIANEAENTGDLLRTMIVKG
jgi:predicted phosphate transport protein (TIGR00153 family)